MAIHDIQYSAQVGANFPVDRWGASTISLRVRANSDWSVVMRPDEARSIARQLRRAADTVDPPKPRKAKA